MPKVYKLEITTTILIEADNAQEAQSSFDNLSLAEIADEMDSGLMIGNDVRSSIVEVPKNEIETELLDLGNDGSFFDTSEETDEETDEDEDHDDR